MIDNKKKIACSFVLSGQDDLVEKFQQACNVSPSFKIQLISTLAQILGLSLQLKLEEVNICAANFEDNQEIIKSHLEQIFPPVETVIPTVEVPTQA